MVFLALKLFLEKDSIMIPLYASLIILFGYLYQNLRYRDMKIKVFFMPALLLKLMGGIAVGLIYQYYYGEGDTSYYWFDSYTFTLAIEKSFGDFLRLLMLPAQTITPQTYEFTWWLTYFRDPTAWTAEKVFGFLGVFSLHSYGGIALMVSALSFISLWQLYVLFSKLFPEVYKQLALAILFIPSVVFWGSGVLKDSITLACLSWITVCSYKIFFEGKNIILNALWLAFVVNLALQIKAYIVISFAPAMLFWIFLEYRVRISNTFIKVISGPFVFAMSAAAGYFLMQRLGQEFSQFSIQNVVSTAERFQSWHGQLAEGGLTSGYTLGHIDPNSMTSILSKFPAAVNVTLFRPYLWEAENVVMLLSSIESTIILIFAIYIFLRNGIVSTFKTIGRNPAVFFCFFFSLLFAFAVGFTSYNFGALVRYKIPCMPFFVMGLVIIQREAGLVRAKRQQEKANRYVRQNMFATPAQPPATALSNQ